MYVSDDNELRIYGDEATANEGTPLELVEVFVQKNSNGMTSNCKPNYINAIMYTHACIYVQHIVWFVLM